MNTSSTHYPDEAARAPGRVHFAHWLALLAVLALEIFLLRSRFKTDSLMERSEWWAPLVRLARFNVPWGLSVLAATLAIGRAKLGPRLSEPFELSAGRERRWALLTHALALTLFYLLTAELLENPLPNAFMRVFVPLLWTGSGVAVLVSLLGCVVPVRRATAFVSEQRRVILFGLCAGTLAFALAKYVTTYWPLSGPMGFATLWVSDQFLDAFVGKHVYHPHLLVLGLDSFSVHVTRACSGYEGVGIFSVFYSLFLCIYRERLCFPRALLLLPLGIAAVWTLNSLRIALLVIIGARWSPDLAINGFHEHAGWPSVIAVALVAVALSTRFRAFGARVVPGEVDVETVNPTAVYIAPLLASLGSLMIAGAFIEEFVAVTPVRVGCTLLALWLLRRHYAELWTKPAWSGVLLGALAAVIWTCGRLWSGASAGSGPLDWRTEIAPTWLWIWWPIALFSHVVVAPLAEELAFRGFLLRRLCAVHFETFDPRRAPMWTLVVSSVLFGIVHQHWIVATCAGMLYALAYRRRGRLIDAIVAHAVTNLLVFAFAASTGKWELWTSQ